MREQQFHAKMFLFYLQCYEGVVFSEEKTAPFLYGKVLWMKHPMGVKTFRGQGCFLHRFLAGYILRIGAMVSPLQDRYIVSGTVQNKKALTSNENGIKEIMV